VKFALSCDENPGDSGTTAGGVAERTMNIRVALALQVALRRCHQTVWFDPTITYVQRVAKANAGGYDVLFACAHNAAGSPAAEGAQFIFCGAVAHTLGKQALAAKNVGDELVKAGVVLRWSTYDENVVECCDFNKDSVYCEFLFQTNPRDLAEEKKASYPVAAAEAACRGLARTYGFAYVPVAVPVVPPVTPPVTPPTHDPLPPPPAPPGTGWTWDGSAWVGGTPPPVEPLNPPVVVVPPPVATTPTWAEWLASLAGHEIEALIKYFQDHLAGRTP